MALAVIAPEHARQLQEFEKAVLEKQSAIEAWFRRKWRAHRPPFYGSVDLRNSGYKMAGIDTNLFPGGFNNLNPHVPAVAAAAVQDAVERTCDDATSILLIPENHTRNTFYLQNVYALEKIIRQAGFEVRLGSLNPEITGKTELETAEGNTVTVEPVEKKGDRIQLADGFSPCLVLLNNDLSAGIPDALRGLKQAVLPPLNSGWTTRRKSAHFAAYNKVAADFSALTGIDDWSVNPYFEACGGLDFHDRQGEDQLAETVARLLGKIQARYDERGIADKPFVIVKADAGTYGMGVMTVHSPDDVLALNRKNRNKMAKVKEGLEVSEVIVQEGIYSYETLHGAVAEPVVYMMDRFVVGGFYRVHEGRGVDENLNAGGMRFEPLQRTPGSIGHLSLETDVTGKRAFEHWEHHGLPDKERACDHEGNRLYVYGVLARMSLLAASLELEEMPPVV